MRCNRLFSSSHCCAPLPRMLAPSTFSARGSPLHSAARLRTTPSNSAGGAWPMSNAWWHSSRAAF
jgi:hypothetical protein